jgi:formylglycine-generating enzyme
LNALSPKWVGMGMQPRRYAWETPAGAHDIVFHWVPPTSGVPYAFGAGQQRKPVEIPGFFVGTTPVTQAFWARVTGSNPAEHASARCPVENVSWDQITSRGGFLDQLNASDIRTSLAAGDDALRFRLPSETEWEYAARGGPQWRDDFAFAGSNDPNTVAWYGPRWNRWDEGLVNRLGWQRGWRLSNRLRKMLPHRTQTHPVALKAPNQLGLFDMSGNVFEWCHDVCTEDPGAVPADGSPYTGHGTERRLRGGSHTNWDLHCRVWWRYSIEPSWHDGSIGFRLVLATPHASPASGVA